MLIQIGLNRQYVKHTVYLSKGDNLVNCSVLISCDTGYSLPLDCWVNTREGPCCMVSYANVPLCNAASRKLLSFRTHNTILTTAVCITGALWHHMHTVKRDRLIKLYWSGLEIMALSIINCPFIHPEISVKQILVFIFLTVRRHTSHLSLKKIIYIVQHEWEPRSPMTAGQEL